MEIGRPVHFWRKIVDSVHRWRSNGHRTTMACAHAQKCPVHIRHLLEDATCPAVILRKNSFRNRGGQRTDMRALLMSLFVTLKRARSQSGQRHQTISPDGGATFAARKISLQNAKVLRGSRNPGFGRHARYFYGAPPPHHPCWTVHENRNMLHVLVRPVFLSVQSSPCCKPLPRVDFPNPQPYNE